MKFRIVFYVLVVFILNREVNAAAKVAPESSPGHPTGLAVYTSQSKAAERYAVDPMPTDRTLRGIISDYINTGDNEQALLKQAQDGLKRAFTNVSELLSVQSPKTWTNAENARQGIIDNKHPAEFTIRLYFYFMERCLFDSATELDVVTDISNAFVAVGSNWNNIAFAKNESVALQCRYACYLTDNSKYKGPDYFDSKYKINASRRQAFAQTLVGNGRAIVDVGADGGDDHLDEARAGWIAEQREAEEQIDNCCKSILCYLLCCRCCCKCG